MQTDDLDLTDLTPTDGLEGLRKALAAERSRSKQLTQELQVYKAIGSPEEFGQAKRIVTEELELMQQELQQERQASAQQLQELQAKIQQQTLHQNLSTAYGNAKGLPQYQDVFAAYLQSRLIVSDDGVLLDGKPLADAMPILKEQYPHFFAPDSIPIGSGVASSPGVASGKPTINLNDWDSMMDADLAAIKAGEVEFI